MAAGERRKELRQRRTRTKKVSYWKARAAKANPAEKAVIAAKLRRLTPGAEQIIQSWGLEGA